MLKSEITEIDSTSIEYKYTARKTNERIDGERGCHCLDRILSSKFNLLLRRFGTIYLFFSFSFSDVGFSGGVVNEDGILDEHEDVENLEEDETEV